MSFNPRFSFYIRADKPQTYKVVTLFEVLATIKSDEYAAMIKEIASIKEKNKRRETKLNNLPAVTFSGEFNYKNTNGLISYTNIICIDIDNIYNLDEIKNLILNDNYVLAMFLSPSQNGLKVLIRVPGSSEDFITQWLYLESYFLKQYKIKIDPLCKDITRLCYYSYDPNLYYNPEALIFDKTYTIEAPKPVKRNTIKQEHTEPLEQYFLKICHETTIKRFAPVPGTYNAYINTFAIYANRYGIDIEVTAEAIAANCGWAEPNKNDINTIKSVYRKFSGEYDVWAEDYKNKKTARQLSEPSYTPTASPKVVKETVNDEVKFWYAVEKKIKGQTVEEADPETGEMIPVMEYKLSYDKQIYFLENNHFFKIYEGDSYRLVRLFPNKKLIEIVDQRKIEDYMLEYLRSSNTAEFMQVREQFRRNITKFCSDRQFAGLDYFTPTFQKDTHDTAYLYFKNNYIEIKKDSINIKNYNAFEHYVWKKQINDFEFIEQDFEDCDFHKFITLAILGTDLSNIEEKEIQKYKAAITGIGYMLHKYKNPALTKAVLLVDKKTRSNNNEMNGGSGKSLYAKAIGKILNMFLVDGQNFNFDDQFAFDGVSPETEYINMNDVKGNFPFMRLFGMLTEGLSYRGLYAKRVALSYQDSPKFLISTNFTLKGDGDSIIRRQHIIEFSSYFNSKHTPYNEFGRMFFDSWDTEEWNKFYNFMIYCIKSFLEFGLIEFPIENYEMRKLLEWRNGLGIEFNDFMNEKVYENLHAITTYDRKQLYLDFIHIVGATQEKLTMNSFSQVLKMWCNIKKLIINAHKNGERDRRNGIEYLTFTHDNEDAVDPTIAVPQEEEFNLF